MMALLRPVAELEHPLRTVAHVIPGFLERLRCDRGDLGVRALPQRVQQHDREDVEQELASDGVGEVALRQLDELAVAKVHSLAEIRERVLVAPLPFYVAGEA